MGLVALHVSHTVSGWLLANESCYRFQTFCCQSEALAMRDRLTDYTVKNLP